MTGWRVNARVTHFLPWGISMLGMMSTTVVSASSAAELSKDDEFGEALVTAIISQAARGNTVAEQQISILLALQAPWNAMVLHHVEDGGFLARLTSVNSTIPTADRPENQLLAQIASAQGSDSWAKAARIANRPKSTQLDFSASDTLWLTIETTATGPAELFLDFAECAPEVAYFPNLGSLPAAPATAAARFSNLLVAVPVIDSTSLRFRRNDCLPGKIPVAMEWRSPRSRVESTTDPAMLPADVLSTLALTNNRPRRFRISTLRDYVYRVLAAPASPNIVPVLAHPSADDPSISDDADDADRAPGSPQVTLVLGSGREEEFVLMSGNNVAGDAAVLWHARAVKSYEINHVPAVRINPGLGQWLSLRTAQGRWSIATRMISGDLDPALRIRGGENLTLLGENDDATDRTREARVIINQSTGGAVYVHIRSVNDQPGLVTLVVKRLGDAQSAH